jgi:CHAT domain-containing protein
MHSVLFCLRISVGIRSVVMSEFPPSLNRSTGLRSVWNLVFLTLALLACVTLITVLHPAVSELKEPRQLLAQADHFAWLSNWQRAGELYERADRLANQKGDKRDELYSTCGRLRANRGMNSISETLAELTRILSDPIAASDSRLRIRCLVTEGEILREDHPDSAHQAWQEVLTLAQGLGDKPWQARAQAELAIIDFIMDGNDEEARKLLASAFTSATARGDLPTLVLYGSQVGNGFAEMGRAGEALAYCNASLHVAAMVKDIGFPFLAYGCKGRALELLGRHDEARKVLVQALDKTRELHMPLEQTQVLIVLGKVEAAGHSREATQYFEDAGRLSRAGGFIHSIAWSMYEAARVYRDEGQYADAERCETEAMNAMRQVEDKYHLPLHLAMLADLKAKEGDFAKAQEFYDQAADVTESLLANSPSEQVKSSLIATMSDTYKGNFVLAAKLGQTADAFRIVETARGRSIADLLRHPRPRDGGLLDAPKAVRFEFNALQRTLMETSDRTQRTTLLDKLLVAEQLMGSETQPANAMQGATLRAHPVDLANLRTVLLPDEVVLEYVLADPTSFCLVIDQKQALIVPIPAGEREIEEATTRYLGQIEAGKHDDTDARKLYDLLLGPVRQLPQTARLIVVPDATLWSLPIETLRGPDGKYVLESHIVSYAPSSTVLYYLKTLRRRVEPELAFLGVGAVPYDLEPSDGPDRGIMRAVASGVYDISGAHLYRLPASRQEVMAAERSLGHPDLSVLLLDADATKSNFKSQALDNFKILHFAVHGVSSPQFPDRAALVLGRAPNSNDDGLLQFQEITQLSLSADLVTLSACDTATGKLEGEEGVDGLAEAFLLAGAKSVVAALWDVDDSATDTLMKDFYTHLAEGEDKASALQRAKLDYLQKWGDRPPTYWAAFTLLGDGSSAITFRPSGLQGGQLTTRR